MPKDDEGLTDVEATTWTRPVVRLPGFGNEPFRAAVNTPRLHAAFDRLVSAGRWVPRSGLGTFPIRFPHPDDPGDDGWHVEGSYPDPATGGYRLNLRSRGQALLMLFLFSDVGVETLRRASGSCTRSAIGAAGRSSWSQPPLEPVAELDLDRVDSSPVERAVLHGLGRAESLA